MSEPKRPPSILFVLEYFHPRVGGVETLFGELARALSARGHRVTVLTSATLGSPDQELWEGIEIRRVAAPGPAARYAFTLAAILPAVRLARLHDVVHTTTYNAAIPAWIARVVSRRPALLTVHEVWGEQWLRLRGLHPLVGVAYRAFEWLVLHLPFDHWHCDSEFTRGRLVGRMGVSRPKTSVIYPAVDLDFWAREHSPSDVRAALGISQDAPLYVAFGRPGVSKGFEYLVEAAAVVRRRLPKSHLLLIVGREPAAQRRRLEMLISRLGLNDHVDLIDPVPRGELPGYLTAANCVVVPSVSEGFGYAAVEAALAGATVVSTSGHSVEEVLDGAYFVRTRDPHALADGIVSAMREPRQAAPTGRFDLNNHVTRMLDVYQVLLVAQPAVDQEPT